MQLTMRRSYALLALSLLAAGSALGGVLPEDRADVLYHRYDGGGIVIQGPSVLVRKTLKDKFSFSANYYEDMISSASIDVKLSASPYKETRKQKSFSADYLRGKSTYSAGIINSIEPDYRSNTSFYSISQDMFGDLTTLAMSYKRGWDRVYSDVKLNGQIVNDQTFNGVGFARADHEGYAVSLSQILTRNLIGNLNFEVLTDEGYLASPYRKIRYLNPDGSGTFILAEQIYPNTRTSNAASVQLKYYLPWRASVSGRYRYFRDTWGIVAHTGEFGYTHPAWKKWVLDGTLRYYTQNSADFFSDLYPRANFANFMARDRELAALSSYTVGVGGTYQFEVPWKKIERGTLNVRLDRLWFDYKNYRNALLTNPAAGVPAGSEPLYKLNAYVLQVFVSAWF